MKCRFCNTDLTQEFIDLGTCPSSNSFLTKDELNAHETFYPLKLFICEKCFLVQVDEYKKATDIFDSNYAYFSSFSATWLQHSRQYTEEMIPRFGFNEKSQIVEVASNDGYLLQYFKERGIPVLGIEPTENTAEAARQKGIETITEFFGVKLAERLVREGRKADLLLGNNVLAHVPDINDFVAGLRILLKDGGIITMEFPHLVQLVANNQFDTIYHEHFSYFSLTTVNTIFAHHGLTIFDVKEISTHGGSLRIFACHKDSGRRVEQAVAKLAKREEELGIRTLSYYHGFQRQVEKIRNDLLRFLNQAKAEGKRVAAYGAAAKGNTLLNYCGIRGNLISFVVDASPHKQGKFLPGSHLPIVKESEIEVYRPDYIVIFPWNIKDEIVHQLNYVRSWNAQFVTAIPGLSIS